MKNEQDPLRRGPVQAALMPPVLLLHFDAPGGKGQSDSIELPYCLVLCLIQPILGRHCTRVLEKAVTQTIVRQQPGV